nr:uncharacterized protein LOC117859295 isoform X2 [Setaria viridis]
MPSFNGRPDRWPSPAPSTLLLAPYKTPNRLHPSSPFRFAAHPPPSRTRASPPSKASPPLVPVRHRATSFPSPPPSLVKLLCKPLKQRAIRGRTSLGAAAVRRRVLAVCLGRMQLGARGRRYELTRNLLEDQVYVYGMRVTVYSIFKKRKGHGTPVAPEMQRCFSKAKE